VRKILIFTLVVGAWLLVPGLTSIAYGNSNIASVPGGVRVDVANRAAAPAATFLGNAFGSIAPGDLFYIDATGSPDDLVASLYITNAGAITHYLRYLIIKVTIYTAGEDGRWQPIPSRFGPLNENGIYLTLQSNPAKFTVPGNARYKVSIGSGSYRCLPARAGIDNEPPEFYLTIETM
jgi:hypothetical protein